HRSRTTSIMSYDYTNEQTYEVHVFDAGELIIISNNCPPLRKSEIEYYAMLVGVHHYNDRIQSLIPFDRNRHHQEDDRYKRDSRDSYDLDINTQQYRWTVTNQAFIVNNTVGRLLSRHYIRRIKLSFQDTKSLRSLQALYFLFCKNT